jgi:ABC-type branched-subunit amino acid transport system substrate-binding protein
MTPRNFSWQFVAVGAVAALALAGCGSDDDTAGTGSTPAASTSAAAPAAKGDGALKIGTLLPQTGSLAFLGPPEFAGVDLAVKDVNAAGGVLGKPVTQVKSDSGDTKTDIASQSVDRLLSQKVDTIVGAASSGVSLNVIDKITGAGVVHFSPANTSPDFTDYKDNGLYFRTAPSDVLQGRVLGDLILADGAQTVGILALQDPYGTGLATNVTKSVTDGGGEVVVTKIYDPAASTFSAEVGAIKAANPDAIALISFEEAKKVVPEMVKQGIDMKKVYFVDGNLSDYSKDFSKGTLTGAKGTLPGVVASEDFKKKLLVVNPKLKDYSYAAESYDAVVLTSLAAEVAKDDSGVSIASKLVEVSKGGEKCTTYADCLKLAKAGTDFDYDGISGPVEFSDKGDPTQATIGIYQYGADNKYTYVEGKEGKL